MIPSFPETRSPNTNETFPTIVDNAFAQGLLDKDEIGISFEPTTLINETNGEITFGGVDPTKFVGPIQYV